MKTNKNTNSNNDKNIEIKKCIHIEEDEELRKLKKGYAIIDNNESNSSGSRESENNNCEAKPLLPCDNVNQIMKDKENKYDINNENENNNINVINKMKIIISM